MTREIRKVFSGKVYTALSSTNTKAAAKQAAKRWRKRGEFKSVRVGRAPVKYRRKTNSWWLWTRG